jgi:hypothetical protein
VDTSAAFHPWPVLITGPGHNVGTTSNMVIVPVLRLVPVIVAMIGTRGWDQEMLPRDGIKAPSGAKVPNGTRYRDTACVY